MDVVKAAWTAAGRPNPKVAMAGPARCARCSELGPTAAAGDIVSEKFTGYADWWHADAPQLCVPCLWAYRSQEYRDQAHLVTAAPSSLPLLDEQLLSVLGKPVGCDQAVLVPLRRNRKHVLPTAQWGMVAVDDMPTRWGQADVERLAVARDLVGDGFSIGQLCRPAPDYAVIRRMSSDRRRQIMAAWPALDPWRPRSPWLSLMCLSLALAGDSLRRSA